MTQGNFDGPQGNVADALGPVGDLLSRMVAQLAGHEAGIAGLTRINSNLHQRLQLLEAASRNGVAAGGAGGGAMPQSASSSSKTYGHYEAGEMPDDMRRGLEASMSPARVIKLRVSWGQRRRGLDQTDAGLPVTDVLNSWTTTTTSRATASALLGAFRILGYILPAGTAAPQWRRVIIAPAYRRA